MADLSVLLASGIEAEEGSGIHMPTEWRKPRKITAPPQQGRHRHGGKVGGVSAGPSRTALNLRTALPCRYIFPPNRADYLQWPVHREPAPESKRVASIMLNTRFMVIEIKGNWAQIRLPSGSEGWSPMSSRGKFYLCPFHHDLHKDLKPIKKTVVAQHRKKKQLGKASASTKKDGVSMLGILFGRYNESAPAAVAAGPRRQPRSRGRRPPQGPAPARVLGKGTSVYKWQRQRGQTDGYRAVLENRREELRGHDLSSNTAALQEWMELIKELDVVMRFGFRSKIEPHSDVRRPRSSSFHDPERKSAAAPIRGGSPQTDAGGRKRSNSFACSDGSSMDHRLQGHDSTMLAVANLNSPSVSVIEAPPISLSDLVPPASSTPVTEPKSAAAAWAAAASSPTTPTQPPALGALAPPPTNTSAKVERPPTSQSTTLCRHYNDPATCKYGSCANTAAAGSAASKPTPAAASTPAGPSSGKMCRHGYPPETCQYGTCPLMEKMVQEEIARLKASAAASSPQPPQGATTTAPTAAPGPAAAAAPTASGPTTPNVHPTSPAGGLALTGGKRVMLKKVKQRTPSSSSKPVRKLVKRTTPAKPSSTPKPSITTDARVDQDLRTNLVAPPSRDDCGALSATPPRAYLSTDGSATEKVTNVTMTAAVEGGDGNAANSQRVLEFSAVGTVRSPNPDASWL